MGGASLAGGSIALCTGGGGGGAGGLACGGRGEGRCAPEGPLSLIGRCDLLSPSASLAALNTALGGPFRSSSIGGSSPAVPD